MHKILMEFLLHIFFFVKKEVRQGDSLSPYLYILAVNALCKIFRRRRTTGVIQGLGLPLLDSHSASNCHYADDIIIFLKAEANNVENAWWILLAFEVLS